MLLLLRRMLLINMWVVLSTLQDGASSLAVASQNGHREIVQMLIDCGANVNSQQQVCIILANNGKIAVKHVYTVDLEIFIVKIFLWLV